MYYTNIATICSSITEEQNDSLSEEEDVHNTVTNFRYYFLFYLKPT